MKTAVTASMQERCSLRVLILSGLGVALFFTALVFCYVFVAVPLRRVGLPPQSWFGSDYADLHGAVILAGLQLFVLGCLSFLLATILNRRYGLVGSLNAFWLCNPVSAGVGMIAAHRLVRTVETEMVEPSAYLLAGEFTALLPYLLLVGWPVAWHLTLAGLRRWSRRNAIILAAAYAVAFILVALLQVHRIYYFS